MDGLCDLALEKLANLSHQVHIEEHSHFDVLTGVRILVALPRTTKALTQDTIQISWKRALDTIDVRIGSRAHAESEPLRHWSGVIGKAYADLQANLAVHGPSALLISLISSEGGRTGGSSHLNSLPRKEREYSSCGP